METRLKNFAIVWVLGGLSLLAALLVAGAPNVLIQVDWELAASLGWRIPVFVAVASLAAAWRLKRTHG